MRTVVWPAVLLGLLTVVYVLATALPLVAAFVVAYVLGSGVIYGLERWLPANPNWHLSDGNELNDVSLTLSSKLTASEFAQALLAVVLVPLVGSAATVWPMELFMGWPWLVQFALALVVLDFYNYWYHRAAHTTWLLWPFHAVHHAPERLTVLNAGRSHVVDSIIFVCGFVLLALVGVPEDVLFWLTATTAFVGLLSHSNVDFSLGKLAYVVNCPEVHRWHHALDYRVANCNFSQNLMLWDHVFGTFRRPDALTCTQAYAIGTPDLTPRGFWYQVRQPFWLWWQAQRQRLPQSGRHPHPAPTAEGTVAAPSLAGHTKPECNRAA